MKKFDMTSEPMIAFDTCLLVRFLADDNKKQADLAEELMQTHSVFIPDSVLLETEWVLRSRYKKSPDKLAAFFNVLLETENVVLEDTERFKKAIEWYQLGSDFADAMHLAACNGVATIHTFDQAFCKAARQAELTPEIKIVKIKS